MKKSLTATYKTLCIRVIAIVVMTMATYTATAQKTNDGKQKSAKQTEKLSDGKKTDSQAAKQTKKLSADDQALFDYFFLEAEIQQQKGNYAGAFDLLRHCKEIYPESAELNYKMGQYYLTLKEDSLADAYFEKAANADPDNGTYQEVVAQSCIKKGKFDKAIETYEEFYKHNRDRSDVLETLVRLYLQQNDYKNAIHTLDRLETAEGKNEKISAAKAQMYAESGDDKGAYREISALAEQYPNDLNYQVLKGDFLMQKGKYKDALAIYEQVLKEEPENNSARLSMLNYYKISENQEQYDIWQRRILRSKKTDTTTKLTLLREAVMENAKEGGDSTKVINLFKDVLQEEQTTPDMLILYSLYLSSVKAPRDTIAQALQEVLKVDRESSAARIQLIQYAWEDKDYDKIIEIARPATEYDSENMAFYYYMGLGYYLKNDLDNALKTFRQGVSVINQQSDPALVADYYSIMGDILQAKGDSKGAFAAYDSCLVWKDDNIGCMNNYAYYLSVEGQQLDKAEQMSFRTIKEEPKNATYLDTYAWILFKQKRYAEAKTYIEQAMENDTTHSSEVIGHAGDIYANNGDIDKAVEMWQKALEQSDKEAKDEDNRKSEEERMKARNLLEKKIKLKKYIEQ